MKLNRLNLCNTFSNSCLSRRSLLGEGGRSPARSFLSEGGNR